MNLLIKDFNLIKGRALFTRYSLWLNLDKNEEVLLAEMKPKTRYNVRLAEKKGVKVSEDSGKEGFERYWELMKETTKRQAFYAHDKNYHWKMWQKMRAAKIAYLLKAEYKKRVLAMWMVFKFNGVIYYPYGASSDEHREVMASSLMMWEVIKLGKSWDCKLFDMWGSLGFEPDQRDPWYGFHRFKLGFGGEVKEFVGSWDLVIEPWLYWLYRMVEGIRWPVLRVYKKLFG